MIFFAILFIILLAVAVIGIPMAYIIGHDEGFEEGLKSGNMDLREILKEMGEDRLWIEDE